MNTIAVLLQRWCRRHSSFGASATQTGTMRRDLLRAEKIVLLVFVILAFPYLGHAQAAAKANDNALTPLNRFPRMVQEYFVDHVRRVEKRANKRRTALKTRVDAEKYVRDVREKIQRSFGPWPKKTPLKPRITGVIERDAYKIEKVIFESRPGFLVTANLYIPKGRKFPLPGVVGTCGHSWNGKTSEFYQAFSQGLALQGYVVLIYDPIGQGERLQYPGEDLKSKIGVGVREHLYAGNQQFLVGEFFGSWRAWDGIRALDYLLTRKEVDPKQIGVTGNSGGGTMTTWLCGVEDRWGMAAPGCFVTTFLRNCENELPADTEQCPPRALALGLDHSDFLAAMAPKPVIILAKEKDYFDARGSEEAYRRLKNLYKLLGAEKNVALFIGPTYHGYSQENREAMYRWFNRVTGISKAQVEPELTIEKDETLWCAPDGQVCRLDSRPVYSFTKEKSQLLAKKRPRNLSRQELKRRLTRTLRLRKPPGASLPEYRILRNWSSRGYPKRYWTTYAVETEPGVCAVVYRLSNERIMSRPPKGQKRAILYIAHQSSDAELREEPLITELLKAEPNSILYTCDVRGIGESQPNTCNQNSFLTPYGCDYFYAIHSIMLDRPYVGQRTYDVLRVLDWLGSRGHTEIHLVGKGWGALPATFAAVLSDRVKQVTIKNALTSYCDIAESQNYSWPLSSLLPGVLKSFDLPDCYRALKKKKLRQIEPWDANCNVVSNPVNASSSTKSKIRIAQIRTYPKKGDMTVNHAKLMKIFTDIEKNDKVDVVVTPEGFLDGYVSTEKSVTKSDMIEYAIDPRSSQYAQAVSSWAKRNKAWVVYGCTRKAADGIFNTALIYNRNGSLVGMYDKLHLQRHDHKYTMGKHLNVYESDFGRFGVMICADRRWPETARTLTLQGARVIFNPTYGMHGDLNLCMVRTRSYENGIFIVFTHPGQSLITDPRGAVVCNDEDRTQTYTVTEIDLSQALADKSGHILDRRPEVYKL